MKLKFAWLPILFVLITSGAAIKPEGEAEPLVVGNPLRGMWRLVQNEEGRPAAIADRTMTKFFGDKNWNTTHRDTKTGVVVIHTGGIYKIEGNIVTETIRYSLPNTKHLIGESNRFTFKVEGGKLIFKGLDRGWDEVWERVE